MNSIVSSLLRAVRVLEADFSFVDIRGGTRVRITPSNQTFFHLVLKGTLTLVDEVTNQITSMGIGDYVFVLHGRPHSIGPAGVSASERLLYFDQNHNNDVPNSLVLGHGSGGTRTLTGCLTLDRTLTSSILKILPPLLLVNARTRGIVHETMYVYEARQLYATTRSPGGIQFLKRLAELLLVDAIRLCTTNILLPPESALKMRGATQIIDTLQIMINEMDRKWSVASLAKRVNMSRSAFAVAFDHAVGKPPMQYLTEIRMKHAADLLKTGNHSVKEIAYRVGYQSEIAFGRQFKKFFDKTPSEYRRFAFPKEALT